MSQPLASEGSGTSGINSDDPVSPVHQDDDRVIKPFAGVVRITSFFLLVVLLAIGFELLIDRGLKQITTSKTGAFNAVLQGKSDADILICGSSRALNHYDTKVMGEILGCRAFNTGMNAAHIDLQLALLQTYLKHNRPPKLVLLNLDLFSFETTPKEKIYDPAIYFPYLEEPLLYNFLAGIDPDVWKWKHIPLYGYCVEDLRFTWVNGLLANCGWQGKDDYYNGFNPQNRVWTADFERFRQSNPGGIAYRMDSAGVQAMEEIIRICQTHGLQIVMVYSPEYWEMHTLQRNRPEILARFNGIAEKWQIQFWDFSNDPISQNRAMFYNSQHMNANGASAFSAELARKILSERVGSFQ